MWYLQFKAKQIQTIPYTEGYDLIQWPLHIKDIQQRDVALEQAKTEAILAMKKVHKNIKDISFVWKESIQ